MPNSPNSATRANDDLVKACAEAVEELKAARILLKTQGTQIALQEELLKLEEEISAKLRNINDLSEREKEELLKALAAKDRIIFSLENENRILKSQKFTIWKGVKIAIVAGAAGIIVGKVFK